MGALEKFLGKPKEVEIDGTKIVLHPLKVNDIQLVANDNPNKEEIQKISKQILKLSIPDATDEEIDNLPMDTFVKIMDEVNKLNGFTDERINKIKSAIRKE